MRTVKFGNAELPGYTIPSGIVMTNGSVARDILNQVDILWTTKSTGLEPRLVPFGDEAEHFDGKIHANREPILTQYAPGCWGNAVGLGNPGAREMREDILSADLDRERIIASVFGKTVEEYVAVAKTLGDVVGGSELNLSCPHSQGHGMTIGQDLDLVERIVREVSDLGLPVIGKIGSNNVGETCKRIIGAGGKGIALINTVGPWLYLDGEGNPILWNKLGGASGRGIFPATLKAVKEARDSIGYEPLLIVSGGISTGRDARTVLKLGGERTILSVGSALAGMDNSEIADYFAILNEDIEAGTNDAEKMLKEVDTHYEKCKIRKVIDVACDFKLFRTDRVIDAEPGQFVFARTESGEKPFSVMDDEPFTIGVQTRGYFTGRFNNLREGDEFWIRGPYGREVSVPENSRVFLVGGGCGIPGIYLNAKRFSEHSRVTMLLGARDKAHLMADRLEKFGQVAVATEDGSMGTRGFVTELFRDADLARGSYFFNCGPRAMVEAVLPIERGYSPARKIYSSLDFLTMCGVGICGKCADDKGRRTCVEGPFMRAD